MNKGKQCSSCILTWTWTNCLHCNLVVCSGCSPGSRLCKACYLDPEVHNFVNKLGKRKRKHPPSSTIASTEQQVSPPPCPSSSYLPPPQSKQQLKNLAPSKNERNTKSVVRGPYFWEHVYQNHDESFEGQWAKGSLPKKLRFSQTSPIIFGCNLCMPFLFLNHPHLTPLTALPLNTIPRN